MRIFKKGSNEKLSANFNSREFNCGCGNCSETKIEMELIAFLQLLREVYGEPIKISSGFRCKRHNKSVGGVDNSTHVRGMAADLQCSDLNRLSEILENMFGKYSLGKYKTFIHVDIRKDGRRWSK